MIITSQLPKITGKYRENADLAKMCWFGVGGKAEVLFIPENLSDLESFLKNIPNNIPINIIGVGSNLLVKDSGVKGIVIRLGRGFNYLRREDNDIISGAAVLDLNLAIFCQEEEITGLEFFSGIPGTIGGALAMNAGAYGHDTESVLISSTAININTGEIKIFQAKELGFKYRGNKLSKDWLFIEARFQGKKGIKSQISARIAEIQAQRISTQPIKTRTGGSTFKNPENLKAWKLIDQAGCRGLRIGGAQVSEMHCNFLLNIGNATATDLEKLITEVKHRVFETTGILLEEEIKIIG